MSNWKEDLRQLAEEAKTGTGKLSALAMVLLIVSLLVMLVQHYHRATVRFAYLIEVIVILALTILLTLQFRHELNDDKIANGNLKSRIKFSAELFAAFAILSFFLSFYRLGLDLDRANPMGRIVHLDRVKADLDGRVCPQDLGLGQKCIALNNQIGALKIAIWSGDESQIGRLVKRFRSDFSFALGDRAAPWLDAELSLVLIDDDIKIPSIIGLYFTLLFSSMAISRKIAIAWSEKSQ